MTAVAVAHCHAVQSQIIGALLLESVGVDHL